MEAFRLPACTDGDAPASLLRSTLGRILVAHLVAALHRHVAHLLQAGLDAIGGLLAADLFTLRFDLRLAARFALRGRDREGGRSEEQERSEWDFQGTEHWST